MRGESEEEAERRLLVVKEDMDQRVCPDVLLSAWNLPSTEATRTMSSSSWSFGAGKSEFRWTRARDSGDASAAVIVGRTGRMSRMKPANPQSWLRINLDSIWLESQQPEVRGFVGKEAQKSSAKTPDLNVKGSWSCESVSSGF